MCRVATVLVPHKQLRWILGKTSLPEDISVPAWPGLAPQSPGAQPALHPAPQPYCPWDWVPSPKKRQPPEPLHILSCPWLPCRDPGDDGQSGVPAARLGEVALLPPPGQQPLGRDL